jgi:hypothetical protein
MAKICCFLSLLFTGLTLGAGMAHLLEMPHKMALSMREYQIVQAIYRGWALLGILQAGVALFTLILLFYVRSGARMFFMTLTAFLCLASTLVIFFIFTYPVNIATSNRTVLPANWMLLRQQWEYSHFTAALLERLLLFLLILVVLNKGIVVSRNRA